MGANRRLNVHGFQVLIVAGLVIRKLVVKFTGDTWKASENIAHLARSYIFVSFQQITFKLLIFPLFKAFSLVLLTNFCLMVPVKSWKNLCCFEIACEKAVASSKQSNSTPVLHSTSNWSVQYVLLFSALHYIEANRVFKKAEIYLKYSRRDLFYINYFKMKSLKFLVHVILWIKNNRMDSCRRANVFVCHRQVGEVFKREY